MNFGNISIAVFIIAMTVFCFFGRARSKTFAEFALSKSTFSSFALVATVVASFVGAGTIIGNSEKSYTYGISYLLPFMLGFSVQLILIGVLFANRISKFYSALSVGDLFKHSYGKNIQILVGIVALAYTVVVVISQTVALGKLVGMISPFTYEINVIISVGFIVAYCYFGGVRSVVVTDILQFLVFVIAIPVIFIYSVYHLGGVDVFLEKIPPYYFNPSHYFSTLEIIIIFLSLLLGDALVPQMTQRLLMTKDGRQASKVMTISGFTILPIVLLGGSLGMIAYAYNTTLTPSESISYLLNQVLPYELKILAILGLISIVMSSIDTCMNTSSVLLVNDILSPSLTTKLTLKREFQIARLVVVIVGLIAVFVAMRTTDIIAVLINAYKFWSPTVLVPLIGILVNVTLSRKQFYLCFLSGGMSVIIWEALEFQNYTTIDSLIPGILANFIAFVLCYSYNKYKNVEHCAL